MMSLHLKVFKDDQWEIVKQALSAAGHAEVSSIKSNTAKFLATLEVKFPEVVADIKKGIADATDANLSGGEKAVKVALDVLASAPDILKNIPGIKDALVAGVTQFFADEVSDFKNVAIATIAAL